MQFSNDEHNEEPDEFFRQFLAVIFGATIVLCATQTPAETWPERPAKWVVPFSPGGANDLVARAAVEAVAKRIGQPIIIENKPGAGAMIGTDYVAKSKPDGYTFLVGAAGVITNSFLNEKIPYTDSDLVPVGMIAVSPSVIVVHPSAQFNTLKEFIDYAKAQGKGGANFATADSGSTPHFVIEMLKDASGAQFTPIPFKSGQESVTAVLGNQGDGDIRIQCGAAAAHQGRQIESACRHMANTHLRVPFDFDHCGTRFSQRANWSLGGTFRA